MIDPIEATAQFATQYSNIVLVAILPYVTDFSLKLHLRVDLPVKRQSVSAFKCEPFQETPGGLVRLTNGYQFSYRNGHIDGFTSPRSYYSGRNSERLSDLYGTATIGSNEAVAIARSTLTSLGYDLHGVYADLPPAVDAPPVIYSNTIPEFRVTWYSPLEINPNAKAIQIEVNGQNRFIDSLELLDACFSRPPPKLEMLPHFTAVSYDGPPIGASESNAIISNMLVRLPPFISKLGVPFHGRVASANVDRLDVILRSYMKLTLKDQYRFWFSSGEIVAFEDPDVVFTHDKMVAPFSIEHYVGKGTINETEAEERVRDAVRKLGYSAKEFGIEGDPVVLRLPHQLDHYNIPRRFFHWSDRVDSEVDLESGTIKSLFIRQGIRTP